MLTRSDSTSIEALTFAAAILFALAWLWAWSRDRNGREW
jgi:hypothetical protein